MGEEDAVDRMLEQCGGITVCANCGGIQLKLPPTQVDAWIGAAAVDGRAYCVECGFEGFPLVFERKEDYVGFRKMRGERTESLDSSLPSARSSDKQPADKKPGFSFLISLWIPGLGHYYAGEKRKALAYFIAFIVGTPLYMMAVPKATIFQVMPFLLYLAIAYDSYATTKTKKEQGHKRILGGNQLSTR